jgi:hypothetical protein
MFFTLYEFPAGILPFLEASELVKLSQVNKKLAMETKRTRILRREETIRAILTYFHRPSTLIFSNQNVPHYSDDPYYRKIFKRLFYFLPELFQYIEEHQIRSLIISPNAYNLSLIPYTALLGVLAQFLQLLRMNTTLTDCNIGFFAHFLNGGELEHIMRNHPLLYHIDTAPHYGYPGPYHLFRTESGVEWREYRYSN